MDIAYKLAMQCGALLAALRWAVEHSHECLDDHPTVLEHMRKVLKDTDTGQTEPTK